jgi:hypothetical protein
MAVTLIRPDTQIRTIDNYLDSLSPGITLETLSTSIETDIQGILSILNLHGDATGSGNWYDDVATVNAKKRGLLQLNDDLDGIEEKRILCPVQVLTNVTVPNTQNYVILNVANSEAPSADAAIGTGVGAVVAVLGAGLIGSHQLTEVAGSNSLSPKNIVILRDALSKDSITSNGQTVFGLLQAENGVVQDDSFNDTDKRVQISFVRNNGSDSFEAVPIADIENKVIEYVYGKRDSFINLPEDCSFPNVTFSDQVAVQDVTLDNAIDNQGSTPATMGTDIDVRISDSTGWAFQDPTGATDIFKVYRDGTTNRISADAFFMTFNNGATATWQKGLNIGVSVQGIQIGVDVGTIKTSGILKLDASQRIETTEALHIDTAGQTIKIGDTNGLIQTNGNLTLETINANNMFLRSGANLYLDDGNRLGSGRITELNITASTQEWTDLVTQYGSTASLASMLLQAKSESGEEYVEYDVTTSITSNGNFDPASDATLIRGTTPDYTNFDPDTYEVKVFVNGNGPQSFGAANDYELGTTPASGHLNFKYKLKIGDRLTIFTQKKL